ncbi:hypothetical protein ACIQJ4_10675 [Streptomyces filamentosus]|uniref:hypothetical protein n=1 Tax=Streptomyces filamentosus TaxID=67294 RepID=UPI003824F0ED
MASMYGIHIPLGGIGAETEDRRDVQRDAYSHGFDFVEDPVLPQGLPIGSDT